GGGITNMDQINSLFKLGIEKVILNSVLDQNLQLVNEATEKFGSQSIVASIDVKKTIFGKYQVYTRSGQQKSKLGLEEYLRKVLNSGVGELILNSINNEGTYDNYDFKLIELVAKMTKIPLVACGGANGLESFNVAIDSGASAVAAGSLFVYRGRTKGILINYPSKRELSSINLG
ncbi:MAG: imidazole glycerol phosphate synthase subunit HisF, partial [Flavobacteriales bacterium]|nr:imidazole glycerol phosphate synthase subunit HisF [Flavobacteriales bacterium]